MVARTHYHIGDLSAGEHFLREAIDIAEQTEPIKPFTLYWQNMKSRCFCTVRDEPERRVPCFVRPSRLSKSTPRRRPRFNEMITKIVSPNGTHFASREWITRLTNGCGIFQRHLRLNDSQNARGACHSLMAENFDQQQEFRSAVHHYERESLTRPLDFRMLPFQFHRDRLLELSHQTGQLDRGREHFTKVLRRVDEGLPPKHPNRAFTRLRLARLYLAQPAKPSEAKGLLDDAKAIFQQHSMTPNRVMERVDGLLARWAEQASHGK